MRRTELKRKTPMPRGTVELKRTPMPARKKPLRRMSAAKRRERKDTDGPRRDLREEAFWCMLCGKRPAVHTHEIARGGSRCKAVYRRRLQMALCENCHDDVGCLHQWPVERQAAHRLIWEVMQTVRELNDMRGRAQTAVTFDQVMNLMADIHWP